MFVFSLFATLCDPMACNTPGFSVLHHPLVSLLKFTSIELVMPSNHLILCHPLLLLPSVFPSISLFPVSWLFASSGQSIGVSASVLAMNIQGWFIICLNIQIIGRIDAEAEAPILWPPDRKNWLVRKDPDAGKDWRQKEKCMTEDEMVGWHHQIDGHVFELAPGVGDGQGGLACRNPWGCKDLDTTERLNWLTVLICDPCIQR